MGLHGDRVAQDAPRASIFVGAHPAFYSESGDSAATTPEQVVDATTTWT